MGYQLKRLDESMRDAFNDFIGGWDGKIIPSALETGRRSFDELLSNLRNMENDPPRLLVPSTMLFLVNDDDKILGAVDIRHFLNDGLTKYGGHIGYGVAPDSRGHGYAKMMLEMAVPYLKELSLERVLICCDKKNLASAKTIIAAGGQLESEVELLHGGETITGQRYWVPVK